MFIHNDLIKDASLSCGDRKQTVLQVYLFDKLPMIYDLKLFKFILNLMEVRCLVQEAQKFPVVWLKSTARIRSNNERNLNKKQYASKELQEQGHCGTLVPNSVH